MISDRNNCLAEIRIHLPLYVQSERTSCKNPIEECLRAKIKDEDDSISKTQLSERLNSNDTYELL